MKQDDMLWKGIIEDMPAHFLRFFFPDADNLLDFDRGFEFLDKELEQLFPADENEYPLFVDKLLKVYSKTGVEEWILIHIEVQGYYEKEFSKRMFSYFYRLLDKYNMPVTALAIFTEANKQFKPDTFNYHFMGTSATFKYNIYKILDQEESDLYSNSNPFAIVVLTVLLAIKNKKMDDIALLGLKLDLFRNLYQRKMEKKSMQALATFLKMYVHFKKSETNTTFAKAIQLITENKITMGIEELVLSRAEKKGIEKGIEKGKAEVIEQLITKMGLSDEQVADIAGVDIAFVTEIRRRIQD